MNKNNPTQSFEERLQKEIRSNKITDIESNNKEKIDNITEIAKRFKKYIYDTHHIYPNFEANFLNLINEE